MKDLKANLLTTGNIAKQLAVSDTKVKQAIKDMGIKPPRRRAFAITTRATSSRRLSQL